MPYHSTLTEPDGLALMSAAFDDAWMVINAKAPVALLVQPDARDYLGHVIFGLWQRGARTALAASAAAEYWENGKW
jgi:hypothetical protein